MPTTAALPRSPADQPATNAPPAEQPSNFLGFLPVREFFSLDLRSLALLRIGIGFLLILDGIDRLPDLAAHFSDAGIVPRDVITGIQPISLHMFHGAVWFQAILTGLSFFFALLLILGWRTPFVTLVCWFLLISVHARNPTVLQGGDQVLRLMLFWSIFLPLSACYSLDSSRDGAQPRWPFTSTPTRVLSPASVAYIVQLCVIYWYAAAWKWAPEWRSDGTAVYLAMKADYFTTRFAHFLLGYPEVLRYLTFATLWLEALGPAVLFFPFAPGLQRLLVISAFILLHVGLAISLELSLFPWICCVAWLALLPSSFWDRIQAQLRSDEVSGLTIYHDSSRGRSALACLRTFLFLGEAKLASAQESPALLPRLRREGGWAVVDAHGTAHHGLEALVLLVRLSPIFSPLAGLFRLAPFRWLGNRLVRLLAGTVYHTPPDVEADAAPRWAPPAGLIANTLVIFCLVYIVLWNIRTFRIGVSTWQAAEPGEDRYRWVFPEKASQLGFALGLDQGWGLFAPRPGKFIGWHVVIGTRRDDTKVDLLHDGAPVDWSKPELLAATYRNGRERKMMMNITAGTGYTYLPPGFALYHYRKWNETHDGKERLRSVEVYWMKEETRPPGETPPPVERLLIISYEGPAEEKP
jgi:hypothetical protein